MEVYISNDSETLAPRLLPNPAAFPNLRTLLAGAAEKAARLRRLSSLQWLECLVLHSLYSFPPPDINCRGSPTGGASQSLDVPMPIGSP